MRGTWQALGKVWNSNDLNKTTKIRIYETIRIRMYETENFLYLGGSISAQKESDKGVEWRTKTIIEHPTIELGNVDIEREAKQRIEYSKRHACGG